MGGREGEGVEGRNGGSFNTIAWNINSITLRMSLLHSVKVHLVNLIMSQNVNEIPLNN